MTAFFHGFDTRIITPYIYRKEPLAVYQPEYYVRRFNAMASCVGSTLRIEVKSPSGCGYRACLGHTLDGRYVGSVGTSEFVIMMMLPLSSLVTLLHGRFPLDEVARVRLCGF